MGEKRAGKGQGKVKNIKKINWKWNGSGLCNTGPSGYSLVPRPFCYSQEKELK